MLNFLSFDEVEIFLSLLKLPPFMKLEQNDPSVENAVSKLRCGQIFWQHNDAIAVNAVVTSHLPVCLYSAAGGKVNRQAARTR
jgi:SPX domain protein involved in polyphosphate accumulation